MADATLFTLGAVVFILGGLGAVLVILDTLHRWDDRGDNYTRAEDFERSREGPAAAREPG